MLAALRRLIVSLGSQGPRGKSHDLLEPEELARWYAGLAT